MIGSNLLNGKPRIIIIILTFILYQIWLQGILQNWINKTIIEDSDGTWNQLEALKATLLIWRLFALGGCGIGILGLFGLYKERLSLFRLLSFHSFLSILGDLLLLLTIVLILSTSSHSSTSFSSSLCESLSTADLSNSFNFGWSIESCEETYGGIFLGLGIGVGVIGGFRIWAGGVLWGYYGGMIRRLRGGAGGGRKGLGLGGNSASSNSRNLERERYYSDAPSPKGSFSADGNGISKTIGQRIFLLPFNTSSSNTDLGSGGGNQSIGENQNSIPMVSITSASPSTSSSTSPSTTISKPYPSLPPHLLPSHPLNPNPNPTTPIPSSSNSSEPNFLVYQPVLMSAEEALSLFAKEITVAGSNGRVLRGRSNSIAGASTSSSATAGSTMLVKDLNSLSSGISIGVSGVGIPNLIGGGAGGGGDLMMGLLPGIAEEEAYSKGKLA